jgi:hypothetical protein
MYAQGSKNRKSPRETEEDLKLAIHLGSSTSGRALLPEESAIVKLRDTDVDLDAGNSRQCFINCLNYTRDGRRSCPPVPMIEWQRRRSTATKSRLRPVDGGNNLSING